MSKSTFFQDFKAFAIKGNAVDLAVGVIIGGAFGKIVSSIVNDLIMPPIGWLIGGVDFKDLSLKLPAAIEGQQAVTINYGNFIQTVFDFIIVAFCVFMLVRGIQALKRKDKEEEAAPASQDETLSVDGALEYVELASQLNLPTQEEDADFHTVAGLIMEELQSIPDQDRN